MNVAGIHNRRDGFLARTAHHNALRDRLIADGRRMTFLRLTPPLLRREGNVLIDTHDFFTCSPSRSVG